MFKRLNNHLLTHYPLIWNTRVVWILATCVLLHLFFFLAGFGSINAEMLQHYYSVRGVGGGGLYTFSILCSVALLIIWLIFYLRNNAFKSFYIIDKLHSAKEFTILVIILLFAIGFFDSYHRGVALQGRSITAKEQFIDEVNTVNLAMAFVPVSKKDYFSLNNCNSTDRYSNQYNDNFDYYDSTASNFNDTDHVKIRAALKKPDAFTYKNYCYTSLTPYEIIDTTRLHKWIAIKDNWIANGRKDSITSILKKFVGICRKYNIEQRIEPEALAQLVFADSLFTVTKIFPGAYSEVSTNYEKPYLGTYSVHRVFEFLEEAHGEIQNMDEILTMQLYVSLCLAILLFCYRLFSRRVFLISVLGTIVWAIIFALVGASSSRDNSVIWLYLFLFAMFILLALLFLRSDSKISTGVLLNWHIYMLPFVVMMIMGLINDDYRSHQSYGYNGFGELTDAELKEKYPFGYWVNHHTMLLLRLNLLFVFLYTAFFFTRLARKWHIMPEE